MFLTAKYVQNHVTLKANAKEIITLKCMSDSKYVQNRYCEGKC